MPQAVYNKFNRGIVGREALSRDEVERVINSGEQMDNWWPMRLGPMTYRPGTEWRATVDDVGYFVPFVRSTDEVALLRFTDEEMRVLIDGEPITRSAVVAQTNNSDFTLDNSDWSTDIPAGGSVTHSAAYGAAGLLGTISDYTSIYQDVSIDAGEVNDLHGLRLDVVEAPVRLRIGTSGQNSADLVDVELAPGAHSLAFTPGATTVTITISNNKLYKAFISTVRFEAAGDMVLPTPITEAQLKTIRYDQSADVVFLTYDNGPHQRIERRGTTSWSIVPFRADDGPFGALNDSPVSMTPDGLNGNVNITASENYFSADHVGSLIKIGSLGQKVTADITAEDNGTNAVRVVGVDQDRVFQVSIDNINGATVTLQRSTDGVTWTDRRTYTSDQNEANFDDKQDNAILYYRLFIKTGDYTSGTITLTLDYSGGSIDGVARIVGYTSPTQVLTQVLEDFGQTEPSRDWSLGAWSDISGYPTAVALHEGRVFFAGKTKIWSSEADNFVSFDDEEEGPQKSIQGTIGFGPVDAVLWVKSSSSVMLGLPSTTAALRANNFGEALTNENKNLRGGATSGAAAIDAVVVDQRIWYAQRGLRRVFQLQYSPDSDIHEPDDLFKMAPELATADIVRLAYSSQPEPRLYVVLADGKLLVMVKDRTEDVQAWCYGITDGDFEDVAVLPSGREDQVYVTVNRTGHGRFVERFSPFYERVDTPRDCHLRLSSPGEVFAVPHLAIGSTVGVWADGENRGDFVIDGSGDIDVGAEYDDVVVGLRYTARYTSNKLGRYEPYSPLARRKRGVAVALQGIDIYRDGLRFGPSFDQLSSLPTVENGKAIAGNQVQEYYDEDTTPMRGTYDTDSRLVIEATEPATIAAAILVIDEGKSERRATRE